MKTSGRGLRSAGKLSHVTDSSVLTPSSPGGDLHEAPSTRSLSHPSEKVTPVAQPTIHPDDFMRSGPSVTDDDCLDATAAEGATGAVSRQPCPTQGLREPEAFQDSVLQGMSAVLSPLGHRGHLEELASLSDSHGSSRRCMEKRDETTVPGGGSVTVQSPTFHASRPEEVPPTLWRGDFVLDVPPSQRSLILAACRQLAQTGEADCYQDRLRRAMETSRRQMEQPERQTHLFQFTVVHAPASRPPVRTVGDSRQPLRFPELHPDGPWSSSSSGDSEEEDMDDSSSSAEPEECRSLDVEDSRVLVAADGEAEERCGGAGRGRCRGGKKGGRVCSTELAIAGALCFLALVVLLLRYLLLPAEQDQ